VRKGHHRGHVDRDHVELGVQVRLHELADRPEPGSHHRKADIQMRSPFDNPLDSRWLSEILRQAERFDFELVGQRFRNGVQLRWPAGDKDQIEARSTELDRNGPADP
jgi:hypothetical protein